MAKFCKQCGAALNEGAKFCKGCGTSTASTPAPIQTQPRQPAPPQRVCSVGYSPVANTPEFRQLAAKEKSGILRLLKVFLIVICVCTVIVIGVWIFADADLIAMKVIITLVFSSLAIPFTTVILRSINRKNRPPFEVTVKKHEAIETSGETNNFCEWAYIVIFKDGVGRSVRTEKVYDNRYQEYYQTGDRCLYHPDIGFFEQYDKSRDTFSLCPFCTKKVELGNERCTHCGKPMLV